MFVVRHKLYRSFGKQNTMVAFIFRFGRIKGENKVKLVKTGLNFQNIFLNMHILSSFVSGVPKCYLFLLGAIRNAKYCISKKWPGFWLLHSQQWRCCFEIWYVCFLYGVLQHIVHFCAAPNFRILWAFLKNKYFEFLGSKSRNIKNIR